MVCTSYSESHRLKLLSARQGHCHLLRRRSLHEHLPQPCPSPPQPCPYLIDGQLLSAPSRVAVVVAGAMHVLVQVLLAPRLISTDGRVQGSIGDGWKERDRLAKRS